MSGEAELTSFLLQTLKEAVTEYANIRSRSALEFQKLNDELGLLEAFLKDANKRSEKLEVFRQMERQIRDLVYDVEDIVETCLTKKAALKTMGFLRRQLEKLSIKMAQQVKAIREERVKGIVDKITKEFGEIKPNPSTDVEKQQQSVMRSSVACFSQDDNNGQSSKGAQSNGKLHAHDQSDEQDKVVDFEEQATIIDQLKEPKEKLDIICITGMAGIGKSTLARRVLHHQTVVDTFPIRIWIHVSQKFNKSNVFFDILKSLVVKPDPDMSEEELIHAVGLGLTNRKFLLVVDDVWTVEDWKHIKEILPMKNDSGSRVLITSRNKEVAWHALALDAQNRHHELNELGPEKSWELLRLNVFGNLKKCPPELESIGEAIAGKCGGSPMAIGVIGGILKVQWMEKRATPAIKTEWMKLLENVSHELITDKDKSISNAIELSYNRLSYEQKMCLLYTGLFPENHEISSSMLKQLWIAEGFIRPDDRRSFEATADKYLHDLINKNLLMVKKKSLDQVKSCRPHNTVREFCKVKALEENLFVVLKELDGGDTEIKNQRRLCLHSDLLDLVRGAPRLRSYHCFFESEEKHISTNPHGFNMLRVLNCKPVKFREFPDVTKLILLKHIILSIDNFKVLPDEISLLINLQTLVVETNSNSITMKTNISKMMELRHIKTKAAIFLDDKKWKTEGFHNLQTMSRLSPESCTTALSKRASNLKTLGICGNLDDLFNTFSIENFGRLENLKLVNESTSKKPLGRLPHQGCFPPQLKRLTLSKTCLIWDTHMPILASINTLEVLKLKHHAFSGISWVDKRYVFQNLQLLLIDDSDLVLWEASHTQFPSLRWLVLKKCERIQKIPIELAKAPCLEKLEIECVSKSAAQSAKRIESSKKHDEETQNVEIGVPFKLIEDQAHK